MESFNFDFTPEFEQMIDEMMNDPSFIKACEENNKQWDEEVAAMAEMTVDELHHFLSLST